jgi:hypothetical protein
VSDDPGLNAHAIRSAGEAIWPRLLHDKVCPSWALVEPRVRLLNEGTLGRGVNPSGATVLARGWARMRSRPSADVALIWTALYQPCMVCSEDVFRPRLGALGVPLIMVPDTRDVSGLGGIRAEPDGLDEDTACPDGCTLGTLVGVLVQEVEGSLPSSSERAASATRACNFSTAASAAGQSPRTVSTPVGDGILRTKYP